MRWGRRLRRKWRRMGKGVHGREPITPFCTHSLSCLGWRAPPSQMPPSLTWDYSLRSLFVLLAINLASVRQPRASDPCIDRSLLPCGPKRPPHRGSLKSGAAPIYCLRVSEPCSAQEAHCAEHSERPATHTDTPGP